MLYGRIGHESRFQGFSNIVNPLPGAMPRAKSLFAPLGLTTINLLCSLSIIHDDKKNAFPPLPWQWK
jgi:hypothetical protein